MMTTKTRDQTGLDSVAPEALRDASHFRRIIEAKKGVEAADKELRAAVAARERPETPGLSSRLARDLGVWADLRDRFEVDLFCGWFME